MYFGLLECILLFYFPDDRYRIAGFYIIWFDIYIA